MKTLQAKVHHGRLILDEPCEYPEGTVIDLVMADDGDDLDPEERAALETSLDRSWKQAKGGRTRPAAEIVEALRARS
jgi:hypothetical protein